jgi:TPR repeat protein
MRAALAAMALCSMGAACHREPPGAGDRPEPSSSALPIALAIGGCDDPRLCGRECEAGSADRCRRLAATYAFGQGVEKDEKAATALYLHACDMGDPSACVFGGQMYEFSHGVEKDDSAAALLYRRACDLKWAAGCYNLAIAYERGTGLAADRQRAGELYQGACAAGAKVACDKAKELTSPR